MKVNIHNQTDDDVQSFESVLKKVFKQIKSKHNIQIIFVTPEEMTRLNHTFRSKNQTTDVLSFINDEPNEKSLGDVFINLEQANQQANALGHKMTREVGFLAVHGFLHLMGYDHETKEDEEKMMIEQEKILEKAKLKRGN